MFKQVCASQQVHAVVRSIEIIDISDIHQQLVLLGNVSTIAICRFSLGDRDVDNFDIMNVAFQIHLRS